MARTLLLLLAGALTLQGLLPLLPEALAGDGLARLVLTQSSLPRLAMALLAGFLLSMAGEVCQRIFANPLAEPGLLGISGGASLALAAGLLLAPALWQAAPGLLALTGAAGALILVLAVAWGRGLHSQALVLAGVMVNLCAAAAHALLVLFNHDFLQELLTWQAGSLAQAGWQSGLGLLAQTAPVAGALWLLHRPLQLLMLGEETAQGLGLSVRRTKLLLLAAAAWLTASVVATVGLIGFVGLAGPALARGLGGRSGGVSRPNLPRAGLWGAVVLLLADQTARLLSGFAGDVPVGAASGLLIGPLLVLLALGSRSPDLPARHEPPAQARPRRPMRALLPLALAVPVLLAIALLIGRSETDLHLTTAGDLAAVLRWRLPPLLLAAGAGACLALSGLLLQRLLRNPLTSPDLLGVGHGAGLAFALAMVFLPESGLVSRFVLTATGAGAMLALVTLLAARARFAVSRLLLIGVGLGSTAQAFLTLVLRLRRAEGRSAPQLVLRVHRQREPRPGSAGLERGVRGIGGGAPPAALVRPARARRGGRRRARAGRDARPRCGAGARVSRRCRGHDRPRSDQLRRPDRAPSRGDHGVPRHRTGGPRFGRDRRLGHGPCAMGGRAAGLALADLAWPARSASGRPLLSLAAPQACRVTPRRGRLPAP